MFTRTSAALPIERIRNMVSRAASEMKGDPWPNGLGFDVTYWSFMLAHDGSHWSATLRDEDGYPCKQGLGGTPARAMRNAEDL